MARTDYSKPDHYTKRAKKTGYAARSVFKLDEIDQKEKLLRPGLRVLDLGSSPGSWIQYVSEKIKKKGVVVGIDLNPLTKPLTENQRFVQGDLYEIDPHDLKIDVKRFDLVISDMMPNTIGHKASDHLRSMALAERALYVADEVLRPGGNFLVKIFQGGEFQQYREMLRERFSKVKVKKPKSSRQTSREIYLLALGKK
jgi:23S rRNA (uridine2552-2'-O)-methyltransferase